MDNTLSESAPSFFTQANNFVSAAAGGVDPRTGLFNFNLALGTLNGNRDLGPALPIQLSYSPLLGLLVPDNVANKGFGKGVNIGLTSYDDGSNSLLSLSTGEQIKIGKAETVVQQLNQYKLKNFRFEKYDDQTNPDPVYGDCYKVIHKSGRIEILSGPQKSSKVKVPTNLLTPAGHGLILDWDFSFDPPKLKAVKDDINTLLKIDYSDTKAVIHFFPDASKEAYDVELWFTGVQLTKVRNLALGQDAPLDWDLEYDEVSSLWGSWLTKITSPGGMLEEAFYYKDGRGSHFPDSAKLPVLPSVYQFLRNAGPMRETPATQFRYDYSDNNFLGYGSGLDWRSDQDNLYGVLADYSYSSMETYRCGGKIIQTRRTYNSFHLMTDQSTVCDRTVTGTQTAYGVIDGQPFEKQPAYFQLPIKTTASWSDGLSWGNDFRITKQETGYRWDDWGNLLHQDTRMIMDGGTIQEGCASEWVYYDENGEDGCPASPSGMQCFVKSVTTTPASSDYADSPTRQRLYRYGPITPAGNGIHLFVRKIWASSSNIYGPSASASASASSAGDTRLLAEQTFTYASSASDAGRLTSRTLTHHSDKDAAGAYSQTERFDTGDDPDHPGNLIKTVTFTTYDNHNRVTCSYSSYFTGRVWKDIDAKGRVTTYDYDGLGRVTAVTQNPGSQYENITTYQYELRDGFDESFLITTTDARNNKARQGRDGLGRLLYTDVSDIDNQTGDGAWFRTLTQTYNELGGVVSAAEFDYTNGTQAASLRSAFQYDNWLQLSNTTQTYGDVPAHEVTRFDPITLTGRTYFMGGATTTGSGTRSLNFGRAPVKQERYAAADSTSPYSARSMAYDGLNRLRSLTDELGRTTTYAYDDWDRLNNVTLPDNTTVSYRYRQESADTRAVEVRANDKLLGTRQFDGLGRLTEATVGGRQWRHIYATDADDDPSQTTAPDGSQRFYSYVAELDDALSSVTPAAETSALDTVPFQRFAYDPPSGLMTAAMTEATRIDYTPYPSGRLKEQALDIDGTSRKMSYAAYSIAGALQTYVHVDGARRNIIRDTNGRIKTVADETVKVDDLIYDGLDRLRGWTVYDLTGTHTVQTSIDMIDDFMRETQRTIKDSRDGLTWQIQQQWNALDQITARKTLRNGSLYRNETFGYDVRNRLTLWSCSGDGAACDRYGNVMASQSFGFDPFNNITSAVTVFTDGTQNSAAFTYDDSLDPCKLTRITNTHSSYPAVADIKYDQGGRIVDDGMGLQLDYDWLGRLGHALDVNTGRRTTYGYDAFDRLSVRRTPDNEQETTRAYYDGSQLVNLEQSQRRTRLFPAVAGVHAQLTSSMTPGDGDGVWLLATDSTGSVLSASSGQAGDERRYGPYGQEAVSGRDPVSVLGYNNEWRDPVLGGYVLGNGYRLFLPDLGRFAAPDAYGYSPFGAGGLNSYAYCAGDPINYADPTGHSLWSTLFFMIGSLVVPGVAGAVFGLMALTDIAEILIWGEGAAEASATGRGLAAGRTFAAAGGSAPSDAGTNIPRISVTDVSSETDTVPASLSRSDLSRVSGGSSDWPGTSPFDRNDPVRQGGTSRDQIQANLAQLGKKRRNSPNDSIPRDTEKPGPSQVPKHGGWRVIDNGVREQEIQPDARREYEEWRDHINQTGEHPISAGKSIGRQYEVRSLRENKKLRAKGWTHEMDIAQGQRVFMQIHKKEKLVVVKQIGGHL
ncbi:tRNA3(Ser)-specific nuclease WapA [Pandoraea horticolens]|uniref:tRNA3(Ser)-specific nuclease WapA n=1 Tax=Pandoraea horticolens TaxID=2508298 RepID=A0A5E4XBA6_9BURK|nr:RHS repeat-associated core domain-containing protein [Pandoraea horticolens]VVE33634.1 tRNA3(Ser)-specific nuclease WapA [Pandoraea horticolens]